MVKMMQLCMTNKTIYAVDSEGYVWYIDMRTGNWALHGNPTEDDRAKELNKLEGR